MPYNKAKIVTTDIAGLDTILGAGLPLGSLIMLVGAPGTGKTILIQQFCFNWARQQRQEAENALAEPNSSVENGKKNRQTGNKKAIYFSTLSEPHDKLLEHINQFDFFDEDLLVENVRLLSLSSVMDEGLQKVGDMLMNTVRHEQAGLIAIDGFRALEGVANSADEIRRFLYRLSTQLSLLGITAIISLERTLKNSDSEGDLTVADAIIAMYSHIEGVREYNQIEVRKIRGMPRLRGLHTYAITKSGITVYPQPEALVGTTLSYKGLGPDSKRVEFGVGGLDKMLEGGVGVGSSTLVAGSPGTGKTLLSLHFLAEGAKKGEPGLYIGFQESKDQLINKARSFGLDLKTADDNRLLTFLNFAPVQIDPNEVALYIRQQIEEFQVKRIVLDGLTDLARACQSQDRSGNYIAALMNYFKNRNITTITNFVISKLIDVELDLNDAPSVFLAENLLLMKKNGSETGFSRAVTILHMRDSEHDKNTREFTIQKGRGIIITNAENSQS